MNWLKKGPQPKLPALKTPDFVRDLYHDLKERHLLPVAALLLVAAVALPILLAKSPESGEDPTTVTPAVARSNFAGEQALAVARATPGLRDPQRRLHGADALDPFSKKGAADTESAGETTQEAQEEPGSPEAAVPTEATVIGGGESSPEAPNGGESDVPVLPLTESSGTEGGGTSTKVRTRYASDAIDVRVVSMSASSGGHKPKTQVRRDLPELTMLPARSTPAATFVGTSRDGKKALLVVSSDVISLFGEGRCVVGSQSCQLLALEPGMPETFVYGPQEHRYRIEVLKINQTLSGKPRRAPLGTSGPGKQKKNHSGSAGAGEPAPRG